MTQFWLTRRRVRRQQAAEMERLRNCWIHAVMRARGQGDYAMPRCGDCFVFVGFYYDEWDIIHTRTERVPCPAHADPASIQLEEAL